MTKTDRQLADLGHAAQRRAAMYHVLLREYIDSEIYIGYGRATQQNFCEHCDHYKQPGRDLEHAEDCLIERMKRALTADGAEVRAMLAALGESAAEE